MHEKCLRVGSIVRTVRTGNSSCQVSYIAGVTWQAMFQRWVDAVNAPRDRELLVAALADDAVVERHRPGEVDDVVERFTGVDAIHKWLARTAARSVFALAGEVAVEGEQARVEYAIVLDDFKNGGIWIARARDGKLAHLSHKPFALPT